MLINPAVIREQAVVLSVELHDFLLFAAIFFNVFNEDFEAALVFALSAATRTRHQPNRLARMSTLREQLKVHPLALSSRLKELLRGCKRDPRKAFHVVSVQLSSHARVLLRSEHLSFAEDFAR